MKEKPTIRFICIPLIVAVVAVSGYVVCLQLKLSKASIAKQEETWNNIWNLIDHLYVDPYNKGVLWDWHIRDDVVDKIKSGLSASEFDALVNDNIGKLNDAHTSYLPPNKVEEKKRNHSENATLINSIGCDYLVDENRNMVWVASVIPGSPADRAGVRFGDRIVSANGQPLLNKEHDINPILYMRGAIINLRVERDGRDELSLKMVVSNIESNWENVRSRVIDPKMTNGKRVAYFELITFDSPFLGKQFRQGIEAMGMGGDFDCIILDLRYNAGGLLSQLYQVAGVFTDNSLGFLADRVGDIEQMYPLGSAIANSRKAPLFIITSKYTASTAEILAESLRRSRNAIVVGGKTYGALTVSSPFDLPDGGVLMLTTWRYMFLRDSAGSEYYDGIYPDIPIDLKMEDYFKKDDDCAIKVILEKVHTLKGSD